MILNWANLSISHRRHEKNINTAQKSQKFLKVFDHIFTDGCTPTLLLSVAVPITVSGVVQEMQSSALKAKAMGHPKVRSSCESTACKKPNAGLYGKQNYREVSTEPLLARGGRKKKKIKRQTNCHR